MPYQIREISMTGRRSPALAEVASIEAAKAWFADRPGFVTHFKIDEANNAADVLLQESAFSVRQFTVEAA